jgi:hypothetical protein
MKQTRRAYSASLDSLQENSRDFVSLSQSHSVSNPTPDPMTTGIPFFETVSLG